MSDYGADKIKVLKGLEAVRLRPGMYIGSTGKKGLHHLVYEVLDNSVDEALAGYCDRIEIKLIDKETISIKDNGRGIPVDMHPELKKPALEVVMTVLHAGGKFDKKNYKVSGGLHGVGVSVVNALSEFLEVYVCRGNKKYYQKYSRGKPLTELKEISACKESGTEIIFRADKDIFESTEFDVSVIKDRVRELAFLNPGIRFIVEANNKKEEFFYERGLEAFIEYLIDDEERISDIIHFKNDKYDIALIWTKKYAERIFGFVNNIQTIDGGTHISGFKKALTRVFQNYVLENNIKEEFSSEDIREGLTAIVSIKHENPEFEGQTKTKLGNPEVYSKVSAFVFEKLSAYFEEHKKDIQKVLEKVFEAARARMAAKKARELVRRKSVLESTALPGKLADCSSKDASKSELFIVEGDSAGGSAKQARNREIQAILPLRGKILNVEKSNLAKVLGSETITNIISALGTNVAESFDISKLRYHKIIIMTDADVDGAHIRTLLLTLFYRYLPEIIKKGYLYIAQPPLYSFKVKSKKYYAYSDAELSKIMKELSESGVDVSKISVQRYKGLGEMNPEELWETTMDPERRLLLKVDIENAIEADHIFSMLMGEKVSERRSFIEENAEFVKDIDV